MVEIIEVYDLPDIIGDSVETNGEPISVQLPAATPKNMLIFMEKINEIVTTVNKAEYFISDYRKQLLENGLKIKLCPEETK